MLVCVLLLAIPAWGKQSSQNASASQPASDPQAVAVVQTAITALGGAVAMGQPQGWTFQASLQGPIANGTTSYSLGSDAGAARRTFILPNGKVGRARPIQSLFVPAAIGKVLLNESNDPQFVVTYGGDTVVDSVSVTAVRFSVVSMPNVVSQVWWFDATTGLPKRVAFIMPAEIGAKTSLPGLIDLSDYRPVSGVLHPFRVVIQLSGRPPEIISIQSAVPSTVAPTSDFDPMSGDL
jgi:hypothetical protein